MLKGLKRKISLAASRIGVKLHWIWAIQSGSMEGASTVYSSIRYRQRYVFCGKQKNKIHLPRLLLSTLTLHKDYQKCDCSRLPRTSCSSSSINRLCVGMLLSFHPRSIKASLPTLHHQRHSRDKIFQAFHAFRTANDKSYAEA